MRAGDIPVKNLQQNRPIVKVEKFAPQDLKMRPPRKRLKTSKRSAVAAAHRPCSHAALGVFQLSLQEHPHFLTLDNVLTTAELFTA
jgi:hypothetical protein